MKRKKKYKKTNKLIKVIVYVFFLIIVFKITPNYEKNDNYAQNKISLIIDNNNVTKNLKYDLFINEKKTIYMSIEDIEEYFDKNITFDEKENQIITVYGEKKAKLPLNQNIIRINNWKENILSGAIKRDGIYYIPITLMGKIYELDIEYIEDEKILLLDSLIKKFVRADISKKCNVKYKPNTFSRTIDELKRAEKVVVIEHLENNWTKVRTGRGLIGYVKTKVLQNEIYIREDLKISKNSLQY